MTKWFLALGLAAALAVPAVADTTTWQIDPNHANAQFIVRHLGISNVQGEFTHVTGTVTLDDSDMSKSTVDVTIPVDSINTRVTMRDNDLKSPNWFDTAQFPTATFVSTSISKAGNGLSVSGNLTLHGVTKPVTLQVEGPKGPVTGMDKKQHVGYSGTTTFKRTDFGIGKAPATIVGEDVNLTFDLDLAKQ